VTEVLEEGAPSSAKPRTASLLKSMDLDSVTLDDALRLLTLPRVLGDLDGEQVTVQNGRYGPYVKRGAESRSLESEEQMFTLTMDEAKALLAQPKPRGRAARAAAAPPLKELGPDSASGQPIVLREGRFGPYVTDGETNASLRKATPSSRSRHSGLSSCSPSGGLPRRRRSAGPPPGPGHGRLGPAKAKSAGSAKSQAGKSTAAKPARSSKPAKSDG